MTNRPVICTLLVGFVVFSGGVDAEKISLNGSWQFAYTSDPSPAKVVERFTVAVMIRPNPQLPTDDQFVLDMPVPGYWDDQLCYIPEAPWGNDVAYYGGSNAHPIRFPYRGSGRPRHPDAGLPFVQGVGWYKKQFDVPPDWDGRTVVLRVGGARVDTYCYLNGVYMDMHHGHDTPAEFDLTGELLCGETNEIVLGVNNSVRWINSCALRGYAGGSGGDLWRCLFARIGGHRSHRIVLCVSGGGPAAIALESRTDCSRWTNSRHAPCLEDSRHQGGDYSQR